MTIGPDIKEVLSEVGVKYLIVRDSGNVTGEYLTYKPNAQVTKPFIREYFLEAALSYATKAIAGDIIQFVVTEDCYIIMNSTPALFENAVIKYETVLYKTNVLIDVLRPSNVRNTNTLQMRTVWTPIKTQARALISVPMFGIDLDTNEELGLIGVGNYELYVPSSYGVQVLDRIRISSSEFYRVETVKSRRYKNVVVLDIGEDVGPSTSTTTTTTSSTSSSSSTASTTSSTSSTSSTNSTTTTTA